MWPATTKHSGAIAKIGHRDVAKLLKGRIGGITSAAQIGPVARLLAQAELKNSDFEAFAGSLAASLRQVSGDDRSFTYYATPTGPAIVDLVEAFEAPRISSPTSPWRRLTAFTWCTI